MGCPMGLRLKLKKGGLKDWWYIFFNFVYHKNGKATTLALLVIFVITFAWLMYIAGK